MHPVIRFTCDTALAVTLLTVTLTAVRADPQTLVPEHVASWQRAIFHLSIPITRLAEGRTRHFTEHCTTVAITPGPRSLFVSAWHCFEHYRSIIKPIQLALPHTTIPVSMQLIESGGSMQEDWALLAPQQPFMVDTWIPISATPHHAGQQLIAAGFAPRPNQSSAPSHERYLLADMKCSVIEANNHLPASNCMAKRGASGGAIITLNVSGSARLQGIISTGDGETVSYFYPTSSLIHRLDRVP